MINDFDWFVWRMLKAFILFSLGVTAFNVMISHSIEMPSNAIFLQIGEHIYQIAIEFSSNKAALGYWFLSFLFLMFLCAGFMIHMIFIVLKLVREETRIGYFTRFYRWIRSRVNIQRSV
jgi:hypothetical protein